MKYLNMKKELLEKLNELNLESYYLIKSLNKVQQEIDNVYKEIESFGIEFNATIEKEINVFGQRRFFILKALLESGE